MTARPPVHVVVMCANRKSKPVPEQLHLRAVQNSHVSDRFASWTMRLESSDAESTPAEALYSGEHWQIARSLPAIGQASGHDSRLWVCSAGYGLIPASAPLRPYAATLTPGHADSAAQTSTDSRQWWRLLTAWAGPGPSAPRSLAGLAAEDPAATMIVAVSAAYLRACEHDLAEAAQTLKQRDHLILIASGMGLPESIKDLQCPIDARLQTALGGSLMSLGARAAGRVLETIAPERLDRQSATNALGELAARQPDWSRPQRSPDSDESIRALIAERLAQGPATRTSLLRAFRSEGRACEQGRFARLYAEVVGTQ